MDSKEGKMTTDVGNTSIQRDIRIDVLKGLAIFLVCWGHCIQLFGEGHGVFETFIGKMIYLVHMPLFIFLSGFVAAKALFKPLHGMLKDKFLKVFLPSIPWCIVTFVIVSSLCGMHEGLNIKGKIAEGVFRLFHNYWFLTVLIYCFTAARLTLCLSKRSYALIISIFVVILIPDLRYFACQTTFKLLYPFFVFGYLMKRHNTLGHKIFRHPLTIFVLLAVYVAYAIVADKHSFIYFLALGTWSIPMVDFLYHHAKLLALIVVGMSGIIVLYYLSTVALKYFRLQHLRTLGRYTLYLYITEGLIFDILSSIGFDLRSIAGNYAHIAYFITAIVLTETLLYAIIMAERHRLLPILFLGTPKS